MQPPLLAERLTSFSICSAVSIDTCLAFLAQGGGGEGGEATILSYATDNGNSNSHLSD